MWHALLSIYNGQFKQNMSDKTNRLRFLKASNIRVRHTVTQTANNGVGIPARIIVPDRYGDSTSNYGENLIEWGAGESWYRSCILKNLPPSS